MIKNKDRFLLTLLAVFMCGNLFLGLVSSFPIALILIFVQLLCLNKEDSSFVFLLFGTVLGAYFAQRGIRFVGSTLMFISSILLLKNMKLQLGAFLTKLIPLYLFLLLALFSILMTTGGAFSTPKYISMLMSSIIYTIAFLHLMFNYRKHNILNIGLMVLIYSLFMVYYMTELMGTRLTLNSFLFSFASFRSELNLYKYDNVDSFTISYQSLGMYACIGLIFSLFSKEINRNKIKFLAILISFVVVWYSSARQAFLVYVLIILSYGILFYKLNLKYMLLLLVLFIVGYLWATSMDVDSLSFLMGTNEGLGSARDYIMSEAMNQFKLSPIFGVGFGRFFIDNEYGCNEHNLFVELLTEMGLVGFLYFTFVVFYSIVVSFDYLKKHIEEFSLFVCLFLAYFVRSMVSSDLRETIVILIFALVIKIGSKNKIFGI